MALDRHQVGDLKEPVNRSNQLPADINDRQEFFPMAMSRADQTGIGPRSRRGLGAILVVTAIGGAAAVLPTLPGAPSADAATDPCAASEIAKTVGNVAINAGMYLDSHPQTNQVLTTVARQPAGPQSLATLKTYFDANSQAARDLQYIQQPLASLTTKCKLPISLPQVLGLMQAVQQGDQSAAGPVQALSGPGR